VGHRKLISAVICILLSAVICVSVYAAIDVANDCGYRAATNAQGYTYIDLGNPANATGTIDYICVYAADAGTIKFAAFHDEGGNVYSTNGYTIGLTVSAGLNEFSAPGDFTAFNINAGEYLGHYAADSAIARTNTGGSGVYRKSGDYIPCTSQTFVLADADAITSIYATGVESGGGGGIDTRDKRASVINIGLPFGRVLPTPGQ
jgi:hypothetical protein